MHTGRNFAEYIAYGRRLTWWERLVRWFKKDKYDGMTISGPGLEGQYEGFSCELTLEMLENRKEKS